MASRTAYAGSIAANDPITASNNNLLPGGAIGYDELTTSSGGFNDSIDDIPGLGVAVTVGTDRCIRITCKAAVVKDTGTSWVKLFIREGSTALGIFMDDTLAVGARALSEASVVLNGADSPSAGSHTYKVSAVCSTSNTAHIAATSDGDPGPAFILIEDLGPAF